MMVLDNHEISLLYQMNPVALSHRRGSLSYHNEEEGSQSETKLSLFLPQCCVGWFFAIK